MTGRSRKGEPQARVGVALLARQIADELFTTGQGTPVDRLVQTFDTDDGPRYLGGWCKGAVVDRIQIALMRGRYKR